MQRKPNQRASEEQGKELILSDNEYEYAKEDDQEEDGEITLNDLPRIMKRSYLVKSVVPKKDFKRINKFLSKPRDQISFQEVSKKIGVSYHTTKDWFTEVQKDSNYSPEKALSHRSMSLTLEEAILHTVEEGYLKKGYFFNNKILKNIALRAWGLAPAEDKLKESFCASDTWCNDFRRRYGYVLRKAHLARRPKQGQKFQNLAEKYKADIESLFKIHKESNSLYLIANMDETSWKIAYPGEMTWAKKGSDEVLVNINYNTKTSITSIATITADPNYMKLPLVTIAKGKTNACEKQLGKHRGKRFHKLHSESGWSNTDLMIQYLKKLRQYYDKTFASMPNYQKKKTIIHLIWDCYKAHLNDSVRQTATKLNIKLYFVPAGGTSKLQPLDIKVFGALKATARKVWGQRYIADPTSPQNKESAVQILLDCWDNLSNASIISAWKLFQTEQQNAATDNGEDADPDQKQLERLEKLIAHTHLLPHNQHSARINASDVIEAELSEEEDEEEEVHEPYDDDFDDDNHYEEDDMCDEENEDEMNLE
jgi:transposase